MLPPPPDGDCDWLSLTPHALSAGAAADWAVLPGCGAVVVFAGTVRDHAENRPGVVRLEYEAYDAQVLPRLAAVAAEARTRWPTLGRLALLHRVGALVPTETSVVVAASAPHRSEAFDAARWCIDTVKSTLPIWKRERWEDGEDWGHGATAVTEVEARS